MSMRIDAHQHYWRYDRRRDTWITDTMAALRRDFLPDDVATAMAAARIDGAVAVQADPSEQETDFLLSLADAEPAVRGVVGWVDVRAPDLRRRLARWEGRAALKGFRHIAQAEADDFLARDDVVRGVARLGDAGYSFDLLVYPRQLAAAATLVSRCPSVRFVLDHCAKPPIASGLITAWRTAIGALAAFPNVVCKVSGLVTEAAWHAWTEADLLPYLDAVAESFGPDRLLFGSDWPVCLLSATYGEVVAVVERWASRLSAEEQRQLFGITAATTYRLEQVDGS
jgi:L-fucono-1,5-lactonase